MFRLRDSQAKSSFATFESWQVRIHNLLRNIIILILDSSIISFWKKILMKRTKPCRLNYQLFLMAKIMKIIGDKTKKQLRPNYCTLLGTNISLPSKHFLSRCFSGFLVWWDMNQPFPGGYQLIPGWRTSSSSS